MSTPPFRRASKAACPAGRRETRAARFFPWTAWLLQVHSLLCPAGPRPGGPAGRDIPTPCKRRFRMRVVLSAALASALLTGSVRSDEQPKQAPKVVLQSPDGKKSFDLTKL